MNIKEIYLSNLLIQGALTFPEKKVLPIISMSEIQIGNIIVDHLELDIKNRANSMSFMARNTNGKVFGLHISKQDTISLKIIDSLDFKSEQLVSISPDSLYTFKASGVNGKANSLNINNFSLQPNYNNYDFSAIHKYQTDRYEAEFNKILLHNFSPADFIKTGELRSSYIEIGELNLKAFRDNRKKIHRVNLLPFQDLIYNYPRALNIDSIGILKGQINKGKK